MSLTVLCLNKFEGQSPQSLWVQMSYIDVRVLHNNVTSWSSEHLMRNILSSSCNCTKRHTKQK